MRSSKTRYAASGGVSIAFQVVGEGPDLLWTPGFISHLDLYWADPDIARLLRLTSAFSRLIIYDKRGTGLSDPVTRPPTLDERVQDAVAVLDAAGSERAVVVGFSEGASTAMLLAARYPARVSALVVYGGIILGSADAGRPWGVRDETYQQLVGAIDSWGEGRSISVFAPSVVTAGSFVGGLHQRVWGAFERGCASPAMARATVDAWRGIDLTELVPTIRVPTVALHRRGDAFPVEAARYVAQQLPGARLVELDGVDHLPWIGDVEAVVGELEQVVTGERRAIDPSLALTTLLFTDIVSSTERFAAMGDVSWRALLERHGQTVRDLVTRAGGRIVTDTGDGFLIEFDGVVAAIDCAHVLVTAVGELGLRIRAGIHCGECQRSGEQLIGITVHIAARVCALAGADEVLVTTAVVNLARSAGVAFSARGMERLKGVPGRWQLFAAGPRSADLREASRTPGRGWHTLRDRAFLALAETLPQSIRLGGRLTRRRRVEPGAGSGRALGPAERAARTGGG